MRQSANDRQHSQSRQRARSWLAVTAAIGILGSGTYLLYRHYDGDVVKNSETVASPQTSPPTSLVDRSPGQPGIPEVADIAPTNPLPSLPELEESDTIVGPELEKLSTDAEWLKWLQGDNLLRRGVGFLDALSRGLVARKLVSIVPPDDFIATPANGKIWLGPDNYQRFDHFARMISHLDSDKLAGLFHWLRPLLEQSHSELGYPADSFDDTFLKAIDQCLATPEISTPIELTPKIRGFAFADPDLEALPPVQKQLLRMGPDNLRTIKDSLHRLLRALLGNVATPPANVPAPDQDPHH